MKRMRKVLVLPSVFENRSKLLCGMVTDMFGLA